MFDLEQSITNWKKTLHRISSFEESHIIELEGCLRDEIAELIASGKSPEDSFQQAVTSMGKIDEAGAEFYKAHTRRRSGRPSWQPPWFIHTLFWNYVRVALRRIKRHIGYSLINIFGLAIGIAVCIIIFLFVKYELDFDSHFENRENIYRVVTHINHAEGTEFTRSTPFPTAAALRNDFPEFKQSTQVYRRDSEMKIKVGEDRYSGDIAIFIEPEFFNLFRIEWIQGSDTQSFDDPFLVILTERIARKYFGDTKAIGEVLNLNNEYDLLVTGVISNPPQQSSLPYDMLISWKTLNSFWGGKRLDQWDFFDTDSQTFVLLQKSLDTQYLEKRFEQFEKKYMEHNDAEKWSFRLQPLSDIHFNPRYGSYNYITSRKILFTFTTIGILILSIACINFVNLTTAQAMKRVREIGLRKVLGAHRIQIILQLLGETSLFTLIALLAAIFLTENILPYLNQFLGNNIELSIFSNPYIFIFLGLVYLVVNIINGVYPAMVLTRYHPVNAFKQKFILNGKRSYTFKNNLVLIQFIISQILIVGTLVIVGQMKFMSNRDLGFRHKEILTVPIPVYEEARCESLRSRWMQIPSIKDVSFAWTAPTSRSDFRTPLEYEVSGSPVEFPVYIKMSDKRYLDIYNIPIVAGRFFSSNVNDESDIQWVVSEAVVRRVGLSDSQEMIGKWITVNGMQGEIIGVVGDFHSFSLRSEIEPIVFFNFWPRNFREAQILLDMKDIKKTIAHIQAEWITLYPESLFQYEFLDDYLKGLYDKESKLMIMIQTASFLAILLGCLGLLGLVSFAVHHRSKEIGIRRVFGATISSIYFMISKEFIKWVVIANIVAWPLAYYFLHDWLKEFAYRIPLGLGHFLFGGFISLVMAVLVMSYQVLRASTADPVEALKFE